MRRLDSDLLRTFLAVAEAGSVTRGARRIHRSQSAASLQIRQLEEIIGQRVFRRHGRGVIPTGIGERLLPVARRVTTSLDTALADLLGEGLRGKLRIGIPDDHSRIALARIIADFGSRHPDVELTVHCALGAGFEAALADGTLDIAVFEVPEPSDRDDVLRRNTLTWMARRDADFDNEDILPVAVFDRDCWWREAALAGLEAARRRYRVVFSSESAIGVRSAVRAGIAAGLLGEFDGHDDLVPLSSMPARIFSWLVLRRSRAGTGQVADAMGDAIRRAFQVDEGTPGADPRLQASRIENSKKYQ